MPYRSNESMYALALLGQERASVLMTDGYKFSMAQAGFPLREETFVFSLRRGGPFYIPFDFAEVIRHLLPEPATVKEAAFLTANGYGLTPAMEQALKGSVRVSAAPKGSWVGKGEPVLTVTGPSFLVSWLEPLCLMFHYPIQIATAMVQGEATRFEAVCEEEVQILRVVERAVENLRGIVALNAQVGLDKDGYRVFVRTHAQAVLDALKGDAPRAFEVGMRAATCLQQHQMALEECRSKGILKTSNVWAAWRLYLIPVGTTGHEHQERWGNDLDGFRAIRDMRPEPPSYLFDTYDPMRSGIPAALKVMCEDSSRPASMRFDSGDQDEQFKAIFNGCANLCADGPRFVLTPNLIFEDGYTAEKTVKNEVFCDQYGWPKDHRMYGYGGYFISQPHPSPYHRDRVSAAFKLSWSGGPVKKFSGTPGKGSLPGRPVILRRIPGIEVDVEFVDCNSLVAQEGEQVVGFAPIAPSNTAPESVGIKTGFSPMTKALNAMLAERRDRALAGVTA